MKHVWRIW